MKIALLGYGKMGQAIEAIALERGHEIVLKIDQFSTEIPITQADVAIDFSIPDTAYDHSSLCLENNIPVVSGTTGWLQDYSKAVALCNEKKGAFMYASNYSVGVNVFFELNAFLAKMMNNLTQYNVSMEEIHHTQKLDAPSGTAITLAEGIIANTSKKAWTLDSPNQDEIPIDAKRIEHVPGTHSITYDSDVDFIKIEHVAHSRQGFALGAVIAAEWILGKQGVFSMKDVLNLG